MTIAFNAGRARTGTRHTIVATIGAGPGNVHHMPRAIGFLPKTSSFLGTLWGFTLGRNVCVVGVSKPTRVRGWLEAR